MRILLCLLLVACSSSGSHHGADPDAQGSDSGVVLPPHCPCPAGAYCDLANNTCHAGCANDEGCTAASTHCDLSSHSCACDDGTLACGGACATCPTDQHATAFACSGDACVVTACATGYTPCGGTCVDLTSDTAHCGTCANDCVAWASSKGVAAADAHCAASQCVATITNTTAKTCHDACAAKSLTCGPQYTFWDCAGYSGNGCGLYVTTSGSGCPEFDNHLLASCTEQPPSSTTCYFSNATDTGYLYSIDCVCK